MPLAGDMKLSNFLLLVGTGAVLICGGGVASAWQLGWFEPAPEVATPEPMPRPTPVTVPTPPPAPEPVEAVAPVGRPVDQVVLSYAGKALGAAKRKDVTTGKPFKVNVYQDEGHATANRAKADLDRDDQWDEKFTFHPDGRITRKVAPADDEDYTESFVWSEGAWVAE